MRLACWFRRRAETNFPDIAILILSCRQPEKVRDGEDTIANTRDACATQSSAHPAEVTDLSYNAPTKTRELFCKSWLDFPAWKKTGAIGSALVLRRNAQNILQRSHLCEVADARISTRLSWYFPMNS